MTDRWSRHPLSCPSCGHAPARHDAGGCAAIIFRTDDRFHRCPCTRTLDDLTDTGSDGGR